MTPDVPRDVPDADAQEQRLTPGGDPVPPEQLDVDVDVDEPEADVLEQAQPVGAGEHLAPRDLPLEADAADTAEQAVVVPLDEDEGRAEE